MIQRLHKLSPLLSSFVKLVISSFISCRADLVESLDLRSSRALIVSNISVGTGSVLSRSRPEGMWCYAAVGRHPSFAQLVFKLSTASVPVCLFHVDAGTMLYRVDSDVHLQTNQDW